MQKKIPLRMCVGCREMRPKRELVRVVCSKDGQISVDLTGKAAGRGAYVCPTEECLKKAVKTRALERAFSQKIEREVFDRLAAQVEHSKTEPQNSAEEKREAVPGRVSAWNAYGSHFKTVLPLASVMASLYTAYASNGSSV